MFDKLTALVLLCSATSPCQQITVAAAADLGSALQQVGVSFEKQSGTRVRLSFGSSGNLTQQIKNGAPFDVFLSADEGYAEELVRQGFAERNSLYLYAVGKLVLWFASPPVHIEQRGMELLLDPSIKKIAIANPQHAPYGRAALRALRHYGLYDKLADRLVFGENVSQAAEFVDSGNAQAGLVALSHALALGEQSRGRYWLVPQGTYPELRQAAVIVSRSAHKKTAADFLTYLKTPAARQILSRYGLSDPGEKR